MAPCRIADETDLWTNTLIELSNKGRDMAKQVCLHTHINHVNEITWVTREAANRLFKHGVIVRNQSVLLKGVNDDPIALSDLVQTLASMNIQPVCKIFIKSHNSRNQSFNNNLGFQDHPQLASTYIHSITSTSATWFAVLKTSEHL